MSCSRVRRCCLSCEHEEVCSLSPAGADAWIFLSSALGGSLCLHLCSNWSLVITWLGRVLVKASHDKNSVVCVCWLQGKHTHTVRMSWQRFLHITAHILSFTHPDIWIRLSEKTQLNCSSDSRSSSWILWNVRRSDSIYVLDQPSVSWLRTEAFTGRILIPVNLIFFEMKEQQRSSFRTLTGSQWRAAKTAGIGSLLLVLIRLLGQ